MLPTKLIISAFASYPNETVIDLQKLGSRGVFLITGETGAGKSTVFDAITFALFGESSGGKDKDLLRSQYADPKTKTYVDLYFTHRGKRYRVYRTLNIPKETSKNQSITTTLKFYEEDEHGELVQKRDAKGLGKKSSPIEALLGLDSKQFGKVVMLSQGDFFKLVEEDSKDRKPIFSKIFDTSFYKELQETLRQNNIDAQNEVKSVSDNIKANLAALSANDKHAEELSQLSESLEEQENVTPQFMENALSIADAMIAEDSAEAKTLEQKKQDISKKTQEKTELIKAAEQTRILTGRLAEKRADEQAMKQTHGQAAASLEQAKQNEPRIKELEHKAAVTENTLPRYRTLSENKAELFRTSSLLESSTSQLTSAKEELARVASEKEAKTQELSALSDADARVVSAEHALKEAKTELAAAEELQIIFDKRISSEQDLKTAQQSFLHAQRESLGAQRDCLTSFYAVRHGCESDIAKYREDDGSAAKQISELESELALLDGAEEKKARLDGDIRLIKEELDKLETLSAVRLSELQNSRRNAQSAYLSYKQARDENDVYKRRFDDLNDAFHLDSVWEIASKLKDGEPCPVCGSTSHPRVAAAPLHAPTKEELDSARSQFEESSKRLEEKRIESAKLDDRIKTEERLICADGKALLGEDFAIDSANELIASRKAELDNTHHQKKSERDAAQRNIERKSQINAAVRALREKQRAASDAIGKLTRKKSEIDANCGKLEERLRQTIDELPSCCARAGLDYTAELFDQHIPSDVFAGSIDEHTLTDVRTRRMNAINNCKVALADVETLMKSIAEIEVGFRDKCRARFGRENAQRGEIAEELARTNARCRELQTAKDEAQKRVDLKNSLTKQTELLALEEKNGLERVHRLENSITQLNTKAESLRSSVKQLESDLEFESEQQARAYIDKLRQEADILRKAIEQAQERVTSAERTLSQLKGEIAQLEDQLERTAVPDIDIDAERATVSELIEEQKRVESELVRVVTRLSQNRSIIKKVEEYEAQRAKLQERADMIASLADTAKGTLKQTAKLDLETFVQLRCFDRVIANANNRLRHMTSGQYELVRREMPQNYKEKSGLDLDIKDYYCVDEKSRCRNVTSISGGEKFKVALSMALGLSDEIMRRAGAISFDTLFIDEGFGSLDSDSLALALEVLDGLSRGDDRLIGIISHVEALKNSIDRQLVVSKNGSEGSTVKLKY